MMRMMMMMMTSLSVADAADLLLKSTLSANHHQHHTNVNWISLYCSDRVTSHAINSSDVKTARLMCGFVCNLIKHAYWPLLIVIVLHVKPQIITYDEWTAVKQLCVYLMLQQRSVLNVEDPQQKMERKLQSTVTDTNQSMYVTTTDSYSLVTLGHCCHCC